MKGLKQSVPHSVDLRNYIFQGDYCILAAEPCEQGEEGYSYRHLELQLNPAISNSVISNSPLFKRNRIPLGFARLFFQSFTMGYLKLGYLEHPAILNSFLLPLAEINPCYLELYYILKKHWSKSVRKCSQGTS